MEKRKLSAIPRPIATPEMMEVADRLGGMRHIATAELIDDKKILLLNFFEIQALKKGKTEAAFRTFLSHDDYITQDLKTSKTKWLTASFAGMYNFSLMDYVWNHQENKSSHRLNVFMRSDEELKIVKGFFKEYAVPDDEYSPWIEIHRFQQEVLDKRLAEKHKKETDKIDAVMNPIKEAPKEFFDWVWDTGMSFARYLIYKEVEKGKALCECTHCKEIGIVDRKNIRLRNNEKGICPFCGSRVTIKAKITDLSVRVESFELQSIADAFGSELDGILPDIEGTVAEKLGTAMHNAMAAGVDVENWDVSTASQWLDLDGLSAETQSAITELMSQVAASLPDQMSSALSGTDIDMSDSVSRSWKRCYRFL